ncbi:hypothetical protein C8Q74DRAFT_1222769 [Fomes fomentarius]|nr:hypothetical protein C8Q74DRAFT_1222769 [Fomes fomentarius]
MYVGSEYQDQLKILALALSPVIYHRSTEMEEVKAKHFYVFASLFKVGRGARKNLRWDEFVKALTSIGFAYTPASHGGSQRLFSRDGGEVTVSFNWDEFNILTSSPQPHDGILTKRAQDHKPSHYVGWCTYGEGRTSGWLHGGFAPGHVELYVDGVSLHYLDVNSVSLTSTVLTRVSLLCFSCSLSRDIQNLKVYVAVMQQALPTLTNATETYVTMDSWISSAAVELVHSLVEGTPEGGLGDGSWHCLLPVCARVRTQRRILIGWSNPTSGQTGLDGVLQVIAKQLQGGKDEFGRLVIGDLIVRAHHWGSHRESVLLVLPQLLDAMIRRILPLDVYG